MASHCHLDWNGNCWHDWAWFVKSTISDPINQTVQIAGPYYQDLLGATYSYFQLKSRAEEHRVSQACGTIQPNNFKRISIATDNEVINAINRVNLSSYVAYCFADVPGYQRIGSYTGNS